ncbi:chromate efflux transporter [Legionella maioricensis]|uniref:Chromate efflux transporter n=1 Tax=Legionella maioricensis TaxID=2896528 RepID=A0A9X2D2S5_9GAMM|nr:chromate efflux transporter [Legionella maioricensis]MCL9685259.1 chromate efflux transporter [Legionella maioricensis]MCL9688476.1 chromate efflux transporter [Legionella maioricensis]
MKHTWSNNRFFRAIDVFLIFLRLGLTSFGGPVAHLGYFREEFVERRQWLNEHAYSDLVALCQLLPGPASSQVGIAIGLSRAGYLGAVVSWLGFTLPSALILVLIAFGLTKIGNALDAGWLHGLKIIAVAVVAQAVWQMSKTLCPDLIRKLFAVVAALIAVLFPNAWGQVGVILSGGLIGWLLLKNAPLFPHVHLPIKISKCSGIIALSLFFTLLILLPLLSASTHNNFFYICEGFFRAGSLVFGGGHVVLPLLQSVVVPAGLITNELFLAGYGAAQAGPGPLFSFAAYLGAILKLAPNGLLGASTCLIAIYLPSFLIVIGVLPFWEQLRRYQAMKQAMQGINAVVVGLLLAALYNPVWTNAIYNAVDFCVALGAFLLLNFWKFPSWVVVLIGAGIGQIIK